MNAAVAPETRWEQLWRVRAQFFRGPRPPGRSTSKEVMLTVSILQKGSMLAVSILMYIDTANFAERPPPFTSLRVRCFSDLPSAVVDRVGTASHRDGVHAMLVRVFYVSAIAASATTVEIQTISSTAQIRNRRLDVTGVLVRSSHHFAQVLEGRQEAVEDIVRRVLNDDRHDRPRLLLEESIWRRAFSEWSPEIAQREDLGAILAELHQVGESRAADLHEVLKRIEPALSYSSGIATRSSSTLERHDRRRECSSALDPSMRVEREAVRHAEFALVRHGVAVLKSSASSERNAREQRPPPFVLRTPTAHPGAAARTSPGTTKHH